MKQFIKIFLTLLVVVATTLTAFAQKKGNNIFVDGSSFQRGLPGYHCTEGVITDIPTPGTFFPGLTVFTVTLIEQGQFGSKKDKLSLAHDESDPKTPTMVVFFVSLDSTDEQFVRYCIANGRQPVFKSKMGLDSLSTTYMLERKMEEAMPATFSRKEKNRTREYFHQFLRDNWMYINITSSLSTEADHLAGTVPSDLGPKKDFFVNKEVLASVKPTPDLDAIVAKQKAEDEAKANQLKSAQDSLNKIVPKPAADKKQSAGDKAKAAKDAKVKGTSVTPKAPAKAPAKAGGTKAPAKAPTKAPVKAGTKK